MFQIVVETLRAICLHPPALETISQSGVIECLIRCFANPNYCSQLTGDAATYFAKKMEELLRHNRKLQPQGIRAIVCTLQQLRNKPYLELQELYHSPIHLSDHELTQKEVFPLEDAAEMALMLSPPTSSKEHMDIYPLFPQNEFVCRKMVYPKEACFTGDAEAFWSCVTNIGKFLETSLKKFTQMAFVKTGGMDALVHLSYDPIMHSVAAMRTKVLKEEKKKKDKDVAATAGVGGGGGGDVSSSAVGGRDGGVDEEEKKGDAVSNGDGANVPQSAPSGVPKMKDITTEISARFKSAVIPETNPKMITAQKAVANSYPHIEMEQWPKLIDSLLSTFQVTSIGETFVQRFHYYSLHEVDGDLDALKRKHQELRSAMKTGSRITCLFSILTRLMRRADIKIIHKSKFYSFMKCLADIIPGVLWYMSCSDTNSVHAEATKLRTEILGLLSAEERKSAEERAQNGDGDGGDSSKSTKSKGDGHMEIDGDKDSGDGVDGVDGAASALPLEIPAAAQEEYNDVFINIRYYECQVVSLMNHFTKFFKNALRIYRRSQDGRQRNPLNLMASNNQNVVCLFF